METLNQCPVCQSAGTTPFLRCQDFTVSRETFQIVRCTTCGFRFTNPRPSALEIGKYYESEEYISHSGTRKGIVNQLYIRVRDITLKRKLSMVNRIRQQGERSILDIGAGTGEFLSTCRQNGWSVTGIEPSAVAREHARKALGLELSEPEALRKLEPGIFSVVTLWHVLEHVHDLDETIQNIRNVLKPEGRLVIAVPNCNSYDASRYGKFWAAWDLPRHIYHFTKTDIQRLFQRHKFELLEVHPMKFDSYYVSMLSEKYKSGGSGLFSGFVQGFISNLRAGNKSTGYSSQIYVLRKAIS